MSRNNTQTGGMIAEEKQLNGTANVGGNSLGSYFQGVASYLPSSIKKQLHISPTSHHHSFDDDHDIVLGAEFDKYETPSGELHLCLMLSYNNGFQVWDLQHPEGKKEIISVREPTPIKSIKFLPTPLGKEPPNSLLAGKRPLLAVVSAEESSKFPRTNVKFFSLRVMDYINILRFKSPVYSLECNNRLLLVGLRDNIYGFDLITMERVLSVPCYPSPSQSSVMAYAANQTMAPTGVISPQSHHSHGPGINSANSNLVEVAKDVASDLAKEVASGLFYLDIVTKKPILHFRAHSQPLSVLRFDPSGTILVTSSVDGHNFNVYQLGLNNNGSSSVGELSYRHLYKLVRGVTNATIQAISPQGGGVNVLTHVPATNRPPDLLAPHKPDLPVPLMTLSVCNRIKTKYPNDEGSTRTISAIGSTSRFVGLSPADERLLVFAKNGLLTLYQLIPHAPNQPDIDPLSLQLAISPITESDMARRTKWNDYRQPVKEPVQAVPHKSDENDMKWLSNVEISTHSPHLRLLWLGCPQFSFRTYQPTTAQYSSSPAARSDMSSPVSSYTEQDLNSRGIAIPKAGGKGSAAASPNSTMEVLFDENAMIPTRRIDIRRRDPLPFKDSLDDLHDTSCSPQTDDLIKESLLDAISTPMVPDDRNSPTFELLNPIASSTQIHKIVPSSFTPPTSSPPPPSSFSHNSSHVSTSTSTLLPPPSESTNSYTGTIPNYYSPYTPPSQHKSTASTTTTSVSPSPPANINPLRTAMSSPLVTSPRVSMSPQNHSPSSSSPKMTSVQTSTSPQELPTQATTTSTTSQSQSPISRPIPISSSAGIKNSPPYSTSPPFPESDLPVPKKNGNNNNKSTTKAEEEEEDTTRTQTSKKKKKKGKNRNNDHEGEVET